MDGERDSEWCFPPCVIVDAPNALGRAPIRVCFLFLLRLRVPFLVAVLGTAADDGWDSKVGWHLV